MARDRAACVVIQAAVSRHGAGLPVGALACGTGAQQAQAALAWGAGRAAGRTGHAAGGAQAEACEAHAEHNGRASWRAGGSWGERQVQGARRGAAEARRGAAGLRGAAGWARLCTPGCQLGQFWCLCTWLSFQPGFSTLYFS